MRRPALDRWLRREIMGLSGLDRFNLLKMAAMAQGERPRLLEPLFLYCWETGRYDKLESFLFKPEAIASCQAAAIAIGRTNLVDLALSGKAQKVLPRQFAKHLDSYRSEYQRPETNAESKRLRLDRIRKLKLEKGISTAEICHALQMDPGNVNSYLKNGNLGRVTLEGATTIMKYLMAI